MLRERGQTSTTSCNIQNVARKIWPFSNLIQHHPTCCNTSQHIATEWPNVRNMLCPTMLQDVALKCCERLARPLDWSVKIALGIAFTATQASSKTEYNFAQGDQSRNKLMPQSACSFNILLTQTNGPGLRPSASSIQQNGEKDYFLLAWMWMYNG